MMTPVEFLTAQPTVTLPTDVVRAVFDVAHGSLDHGSGMLDTDDIAALLTVARALLPDDHDTVLDLAAEQMEMANANPEPHGFQPDRRLHKRVARCLECGREWHRHR